MGLGGKTTGTETETTESLIRDRHLRYYGRVYVFGPEYGTGWSSRADQLGFGSYPNCYSFASSREHIGHRERTADIRAGRQTAAANSREAVSLLCRGLVVSLVGTSSRHL